MASTSEKRAGGWVGRRATIETRKAAAVGALAVIAALAATVVAARGGEMAMSVSLLVGAGVLYSVATRRFLATRPWILGARSEVAVGLELDRLRTSGFGVRHDVEQRGEGNMDHIVLGSPYAYLVETKHRRYRPEDLVKAKRQAAKLKPEVGRWVTPVICLERRDQRPFRPNGVWVMGKGQIVDWILSRR